MDRKITLEAFMAQQPSQAKVSKLEPWCEDIFTLKNNGYTQKQILEYLALNGVKVSQTALNSFIKVRQSKQNTAIVTKMVQTDLQKDEQIEGKEQMGVEQIDASRTNEQPISKQPESQRTDRPGIRRWPSADEIDESTLY